MNVKDMRGVWVTMVTPFDEEYRVDYSVMKDQVEWYIGRGVNGIFAVCQSSEMDLLDRAERKKNCGDSGEGRCGESAGRGVRASFGWPGGTASGCGEHP